MNHIVKRRVKPCICSICHKQFLNKSTLALHYLVHTGEKPYACDICHKGFSQKSNLKTHHRVHTGEKPYACSICHKEFSKKEQVTQHQLVHKPYACDAGCNKIENLSYMDSDGDAKAKKTPGVTASVCVSQSSFTTTVAHGSIRYCRKNYLSDLKEGVALAQHIYDNSLKDLERAEKAVDDAKTLVEMQSKLLDNVERNRREFPLPGSDTFHKALESSLSGQKEGVLIAKGILINEVKAAKRAKEFVDDAKTLVKMKSKILDDAKRISQKFRGGYASTSEEMPELQRLDLN